MQPSPPATRIHEPQNHQHQKERAVTLGVRTPVATKSARCRELIGSYVRQMVDAALKPQPVAAEEKGRPHQLHRLLHGTRAQHYSRSAPAFRQAYKAAGRDRLDSHNRSWKVGWSHHNRMCRSNSMIWLASSNREFPLWLGSRTTVLLSRTGTRPTM